MAMFRQRQPFWWPGYMGTYRRLKRGPQGKAAIKAHKKSTHRKRHYWNMRQEAKANS